MSQSLPSTYRGVYSRWFYLPAAVVFVVFFLTPTAISFFFAFTRWTLFDWEWIGFENFEQFFKEPALTNGLRNTIIYAAVTSSLKVVLGLLLAVLLTSRIRARGVLRTMVFIPVLLSTVAVGVTFEVLLHPSDGLVNVLLDAIGIDGPAWLTDTRIALLSVALVDVWKGVGLATLIYIAGIVSIPTEYIEAVSIDGGGFWQRLRYVIIPLARPATFTVILLSFVGGLRTFDLIWTMTGGGPGFTTDVLASTIYKQYQAGFYGLVDGRQRRAVPRGHSVGLSDAALLHQQRAPTVKIIRRYWLDAVALVALGIVFLVPFVFIVLTAAKSRPDAAKLDFTLPEEWRVRDNLREVFAYRDNMLVTAFKNSLLLTVISVTFIVLLSAMVGFVAQRRQDGWSKAANVMVFSGLIIPPAVVPTIFVLQEINLFKSLTGLILVEIAITLPFGVLLTRAFLTTVPRRSTRRRFSTGPAASACSFESCCHSFVPC